MVIGGAPEPSPERVAAWSAVVAKPQSEPGKATTATKPPVPPAPKPSTTSAEKPPRPEPLAPLAAAAAQCAAPAAAEQPAPTAPTAPQAPLEALTKSDAALPAPAPVGPPAAGLEPQTFAPASSPQAASATTGGPAQLIVPPAVDPAAPVAPPVAQQAQPAPQSLQSHVPAPLPPAVAASTPVPGSRLQLPPVPPVAGVEFVAGGGGAVRAGGPAPLAVEEPFQFLAHALQPPRAHVPEATLGQLFRLAESFHALLLIQVLAHSSLPAAPPESFLDRHRESCLDAADQLAVLLAPVQAAPAEGGVAAAGQLDEAVRGLRRHLRAGSGAAAIGASTLVVRELWRTLTGVLHALGAHRM
ncbi:unnamed protein product [Closterium sp. Naga37s-1]|nr:unnamed protein product [Closterium sp. Naga37s-1]